LLYNYLKKSNVKLLFFVRFKHAHVFRNSLSNVYMVLIYASINVLGGKYCEQ